jgi:hypothetical protein
VSGATPSAPRTLREENFSHFFKTLTGVWEQEIGKLSAIIRSQNNQSLTASTGSSRVGIPDIFFRVVDLDVRILQQNIYQWHRRRKMLIYALIFNPLLLGLLLVTRNET